MCQVNGALIGEQYGLQIIDRRFEPDKRLSLYSPLYTTRIYVLYKSMTTLTATQARVNLSSVLRRALKGDDIGIVVEGKIVALRPVEVISRDYAEREYGITQTQMNSIARKLHEKAEKSHLAGKSKTFSRSLDTLIKNRD